MKSCILLWEIPILSQTLNFTPVILTCLMEDNQVSILILNHNLSTIFFNLQTRIHIGEKSSNGQTMVARGYDTLYRRLQMEICFRYFELNIFKMCFYIQNLWCLHQLFVKNCLNILYWTLYIIENYREFFSFWKLQNNNNWYCMKAKII